MSLHNTEDGFQRIHSERRVQQVFNQLQLAIFAGRLTPGELIREAVLARDLGVSQATVREALTKLEPLGLVVRTPHRRTEVKNLTRAELDDRIKVRIHLETLAFLEALKNGWDEQDYVQLEFLARKIFEDPIGDLKFHRYIWTAAAMARSWRPFFSSAPAFSALSAFYARPNCRTTKTGSSLT